VGHKPYYVSFPAGCTIVYSASAKKAERYTAAELGNGLGPYSAREATPDDINWVLGMGGMIHNKPRAKEEAK
jgi:hypothetical protein